MAFIMVSCQLDENTSFNARARSVTNNTQAVHNVDANDIQRVDAVTYEIFGDKKKALQEL